MCVGFACSQERKFAFDSTIGLLPQKVKLTEVIFPASIAFENGNLFISNTTPSDDHPQVIFRYSPDIKLVNSFGYKGRGPGEFSMPFFCNSPESDTLYLSGYNDRSIKQWIVGENGELSSAGSDIVINRTLSTNVNNVCITGENLFYYDIMANKVVKADIGDNCRIVGEVEMDTGETDVPLFPQGVFGANGSVMVYVHMYSNLIDLFDVGTMKRIKRFSVNPPIPQTFDPQNPFDVVYGYANLFVGADKIYALYSGKSSTDEDKARYLEVFDNSGEPIIRYHLTEAMNAFTMDEANNVLYGVSYREPDFVLKYDLSTAQR
jgi:hypothetical protein